MRKILPLLFIAIVIYSCGSNDKKTNPVAENPAIKIDSTLITDSSWGAVTTTTDLAALQNLFGPGNVKDERICGPECADSIDVTIVYPGKDNEITVYWKDSLYHKTISMIESYAPNSPYRTDKGLKVGSSFDELLKINGKKIIFSGFDWDYGGIIQDYGTGALQNSNINYRLGLTEDAGSELSGDSEFNSDMPVVKKSLEKIKIVHISLSLSK